jgi:hypothetical protein
MDSREPLSRSRKGDTGRRGDLESLSATDLDDGCQMGPSPLKLAGPCEAAVGSSRVWGGTGPCVAPHSKPTDCACCPTLSCIKDTESLGQLRFDVVSRCNQPKLVRFFLFGSGFKCHAQAPMIDSGSHFLESQVFLFWQCLLPATKRLEVVWCSVKSGALVCGSRLVPAVRAPGLSALRRDSQSVTTTV